MVSYHEKVTTDNRCGSFMWGGGLESENKKVSWITGFDGNSSSPVATSSSLIACLKRSKPIVQIAKQPSHNARGSNFQH